jgi:hypothetical protein
MSTTDNVARVPNRHSWPWWLRTPHSRLFSEWIELKTEPGRDDKAAGGDSQAPAA